MSNQQQYWNEIIDRYKASGLTRPEFCKQNELSWNQFHYRLRLYSQSLKTMSKELTISHPISSDSFEKITITPTLVASKSATKVVDLVVYLPNQIRCKIAIDISTNEFPTLLKQLVAL